MSPLGAKIPPELFEDILFHVVDTYWLWNDEDPMVRQEKMKNLSACALTCVYWARMTRRHMFRQLVLRSAKDTSGLRSLLMRASPSNRIDPIGTLLVKLAVYYKLGDLPWFHNVPGLVASGAYNLERVAFHVLGPVPSAFTAGDTRRSVAHPLFFAVPRVIPMTSFHKLIVDLYIENIHFTHYTMLYNLLQDCKLLHPRTLYSINLTWDHDPTATPSSFGWILAHHSHFGSHYLEYSQCTDNVLAAAMALSIPRHESFHRPHLNSIDSSSLLDIMRASCGQDTSAVMKIRSISGFDDVQRCTAARLTPDCDLAFQWWHNEIIFTCVASRRPGDNINIRCATHIIIEPASSDRLTLFMEHIKAIDWGMFLSSVQTFPDLRGIVIQFLYLAKEEEWRKCLVELVPLLREAWVGVDTILQLCYDAGDWESPKWTQILLSSVLEDIDRMRELEEAVARSLSINQKSNVEAEPPVSDSHGDHIPVSNS